MQSFQLYIFMIFKSFLTSVSHPVWGLPNDLVAMGFHSNAFFTILSSGILCACPSQPNLCDLMQFITLLFHNIFYFIFFRSQGFFYTFLILFCLIITFWRKWSESIQELLIALIYWITFLLSFIRTLSVWFMVLRCGDTRVAFRICLYLNFARIIIMLFATVNLHNVSPLLFVYSSKVCLPVTLLYICFLPKFSFRSPSIITESLFRVLSDINCKSS
jgi:hypothetical protein